MANRHLDRSIVLQTIFEWDFAGRKADATEILKRNFQEFTQENEIDDFTMALYSGVMHRINDLDNVISSSAKDWPLDQIGIIDRNILRIGLYELLYSDRDEVPAKVAINEAIELAKIFGGEQTSSFINGVLGNIYKEIDEPGKDHKKGERNPDSKPRHSRITHEELVGAVIYSLTSRGYKFCLVHDIFGFWTLSKGHTNAIADPEGNLVRVVREELGLSITPREHLGFNEYGTYQPEAGKLKKRVSYYLAESKSTKLKLADKSGLDDAAWFALEELPNLKIYDDITVILTKAINILASK